MFPCCPLSSLAASSRFRTYGMQIAVKRFAFKVEYFEFTAHTDWHYRLLLPYTHTRVNRLQPVTDPCHPVLCESVDILSKLELWAVGLLFLDCQQRLSRPVVPSILPASPACPGPIAPLSPYLLSAFAATPPLHAVCHRCHVKLCDRKQQSRCWPNFTEVHLHPQ